MSERSLAAPSSGARVISSSATSYVVQPGDTLYSIAWRYNKDFRAMARANQIGADYRIYPGQRLRLTEAPLPAAPARRAATPAPSPATGPSTRTQSSAPARSPATAPARTPSAVPAARPTPTAPPQPGPPVALHWRWPASGKLLRGFRDAGRLNNGLDIAGAQGSPVLAAATGRVVYAGSGLLGYGNLIIINHNEQFLSAYAHNSRLLVKENQTVTAGQKIAEIGNSGTTRTMLHFEIRKDGKPVNPLHYLPKR